MIGSLLLGLALIAPSSEPAQTQSPVDSEQVSLAIQGGIEFLAGDQNPDGSWGGYVNQTFTSSFANVQTYRMWQIGTTGLATRTMLEQGSTAAHEAATDRALDYLIENAKAKRPAAWDVDNNWALIYSLDAVSRALQHPRYKDHEKTPELRKAGQVLLQGLHQFQSPRGGWGYYANSNAAWRPEWCTSFMTAAGVLALIEAQQAGLDVDEKMYKTSVKALEMARLPNGAFDYDVNVIPRHLRGESINQVKGSLGRIQVGHLALYRAGKDVSLKDIEWGLEQFVKHHKFLAVARNKPIPHEAYYANAAYFYLFAHYYASQVVQLLPKETRAKFIPAIQEGILDARQKNGCMWDFWIAKSTKPYGTAFGVMGLVNTVKELE